MGSINYFINLYSLENPMIIKHIKFPVRMELDDPFDSISTLVLQDFCSNAWRNWSGILYHNDKQLELFNTLDYKKWDRFGRPYEKPKSAYVEETKHFADDFHEGVS